MDRGAWRASVHGVAKSWTQLSDFTSLHTHGRHSAFPLCLLSQSRFAGRPSAKVLRDSASLQPQHELLWV